MSEINTNSILLRYQGPLQMDATNPNTVVIAGGTASVPTGRLSTVEWSSFAVSNDDTIGVDTVPSPEGRLPAGPGVQIFSQEPETEDHTECCCECCCEGEPTDGLLLCQGAPEPAPVPICGPDVTEWFAEEVNRHLYYWYRVTTTNSGWTGGFKTKALVFYPYGKSIAYKWIRFKNPALPICPQDCGDTYVTLCKTCIHVSELGNFVGGAVGAYAFDPVDWGRYWDANASFGLGARNSAAAFIAGMAYGWLARYAIPTPGQFCWAFKGPHKWIIETIIGGEHEPMLKNRGMATTVLNEINGGRTLPDLMEHKRCWGCITPFPVLTRHISFSMSPRHLGFASNEGQFLQDYIDTFSRDPKYFDLQEARDVRAKWKEQNGR